MKIPKTFVFLAFIMLTGPVTFAQDSIAVGNPAPHFILKLLNSEENINLSSFKDTVLFFEFWATWCGPCVNSFPRLNDLVAEFKEQPIKFFSVSYENEGKVLKFLKSHKLNTIVVLDKDLSMWKQYRAWAIPYSVIIDKNKNISSFNNLDKVALKNLLDGKIKWINKFGEVPSFYGSTEEEYNFYKRNNE
jgi:peroxiredoxin